MGNRFKSMYDEYFILNFYAHGRNHFLSIDALSENCLLFSPIFPCHHFWKHACTVYNKHGHVLKNTKRSLLQNKNHSHFYVTAKSGSIPDIASRIEDWNLTENFQITKNTQFSSFFQEKLVNKSSDCNQKLSIGVSLLFQCQTTAIFRQCFWGIRQKNEKNIQKIQK